MSEKLKGKDQFHNPEVDRRIMLLTTNFRDCGYGLDSKGPGTGSLEGFCENCNETLESIKSGEFADQLKHFQHLKKNCALLDYSVLRSSKKMG
jgi:hypothetical protein